MDIDIFFFLLCITWCVYIERDAPTRIVLTLYIMVRTSSKFNLWFIRTVSHPHPDNTKSREFAPHPADNTKSREFAPYWTIGLKDQVFFISYKGIKFMGSWINGLEASNWIQSAYLGWLQMLP